MIPLARIREARERIGTAAVRTPLVQFETDAPCDIWLKLECLQPIGAFKIRGAVNAIRSAPCEAVAKGVVTASAGNMGLGIAWAAREVGVPASVAVPEQAAAAKLAPIERLGGRIMRLPYDAWWRSLEESRVEGAEGLFIHPVQDELVMAGNGTIGLEIIEDLPEVDAVVVPFGGGGLVTGIASALQELSPRTRVLAAEPDTAAPLAASLAAGALRDVDYSPSFVDGAGARVVLAPMWSWLRELVDGCLAIPLEQVAAAVRLLAECGKVVAEGAGALPVAAALSGAAGTGRVVCVVSGGNIDPGVLARILRGETP